MLHHVGERFVAEFILVRIRRFPNHDSTKGIRKARHILGNQQIGLHGGDVIVRAGGGTRAGRQSDIELSVRVTSCFNDIHPFVKVETIYRAFDIVTGGAALSVIELHPNEVEVGVGNRVVKLQVRYRALRRTRNVEGTTLL